MEIVPHFLHLLNNDNNNNLQLEQLLSEVSDIICFFITFIEILHEYVIKIVKD